MEVFIFLLIAIAGLYMAWNIGANDLANAMGTSVGSKSLTIKQVIIIAGALEIIGAVFFGKKVTSTVAKGIAPIELIDPHFVTIGALAAIIAAGLWITIATYYALPVSTTHAIVGAMLGFGVASVFQGLVPLSGIEFNVLSKIVLSWVISPVAGAFVAFLIFNLIRHFFFRTLNQARRSEKVFRYLQVISASYVAFAHGSNDVANAVGPMSAALGYLGEELPIWVLLMGGVGITIGIATWGPRVIRTVGEKITNLTPTRGFSAELSAASVVIVCSSMGLPISTTHTLVGAVIGVGLAGGMTAINLSVIKNIIYSWIITVPAAMLLTMVIYYIFIGVGL